MSNTQNLPTISYIFEQANIRFEMADGKLWVCANAKDVCEALDLANVSQAVSKLEEYERRDIISSDVTGRNQDMIFVSESGMYKLIFQSRKEKARAFQNWVAEDVIPSIRKKGYYGIAAISHSERSRSRKEFREIVDRLKTEKDSFAYKVLLDQLVDVSHELGQQLPPLEQLGEDRFQQRLENI